MTIHYTSHQHIRPHGNVVQDDAKWPSWPRDILVGACVFVGLLAFGALPIVFRFWLAMPHLTAFPQ